MSFISKSYQIVLDRANDTPGHVNDVVDGFNYIQKRYLANCLRMRSTPEVDNIHSKCMRVDTMTKIWEISFSEECKRLLDLCDEISNKGYKKYAKQEAKARLNHA